MVKLLENISLIAENAASELELLLLDVNLRGNDRNRIIEIFVDGKTSVSAEVLAVLSKNINSVLEEKNLIESSYRLDVSTPGVDRPLKFLLQYYKHINRNLDLVYDDNGIHKNIKAKLESVEGDYLLFTKSKSIIKINFKDIISAKVQISFS